MNSIEWNMLYIYILPVQALLLSKEVPCVINDEFVSRINIRIIQMNSAMMAFMMKQSLLQCPNPSNLASFGPHLVISTCWRNFDQFVSKSVKPGGQNNHNVMIKPWQRLDSQIICYLENELLLGVAISLVFLQEIQSPCHAAFKLVSTSHIWSPHLSSLHVPISNLKWVRTLPS